MKYSETLPKILNFASVLAVTAGLMFAGSTTLAGGNGPVKGASLLMQQKDAAATPTNATPVTPKMACPKCKDIVVTRTLDEKGQLKNTVSTRQHLCPTCEQKTVMTGTGKNAQVAIKHLCAEGQGNCCMAQK